MAGFRVTVGLGPLHELTDSLRVVADAAQDFRPVFRPIRDAWVESNKRMFATSGASKGHPWVQPSGEELRRYVRGYKAAVGGGGRLLVFDKNPNARQLMRSLTETGHRLFVGDPDQSPHVMKLGTLVDYSRNHDGRHRAPDWLGGYIIPRREHVLLGIDTERRIDAIMEARAVQLAQAIGTRLTLNDLRGLPLAAGGVL